jgi:hypothetical protein
VKNTGDLLDLLERVVAASEAAGEEYLPLPTHVVRALLEAAKRAPKGRGGQPTPGRQQIRDLLNVYRARKLKQELRTEANKRGERLKAADAALQAAKQVSRKSRLSPTEIGKRMERRKSRR